MERPKNRFRASGDFMPKNRWLRYALSIYVIVALSAPLLAGREPLVMKYNGNYYCPSFDPDPYFEIKYSEDSSAKKLKRQIDWRLFDAEWKIMPLSCYSPEDIDLKNANFVSPFAPQFYQTTTGTDLELPLRYRHWLGTTGLGGDVLSILIYGCTTSLIIGLFSMLIAGLIGLTLGSLAGFYANDRMTASLGDVSAFILAIPLGLFYGNRIAELISLHSMAGHILMVVVTLPASHLLLRKILIRVPLFRSPVRLKFDLLYNLLTSGFISIPRLIIILILSVLFPPSLFSVILIIGFISWMEIARTTRIELMQLRNSGFMDYARSSGMSDLRILFKHGLPNISAITVNLIIAGAASAIVTESALSFLGVGIPPGTPSWGSLLAEARTNFNAWWLVIFPSTALFIVTLAMFKATDRSIAVR